FTQLIRFKRQPRFKPIVSLHRSAFHLLHPSWVIYSTQTIPQRGLIQSDLKKLQVLRAAISG
ncbi:hypothetical protein FRC03_008169, partial [Tulasnella sp. 419]